MLEHLYAGKHTYRDDITPEQMAEVTFENYGPNFNAFYQKGDVVVGGLNFGTGSSREQAATALKFKGIPCVIAARTPANANPHSVDRRNRATQLPKWHGGILQHVFPRRRL